MPLLLLQFIPQGYPMPLRAAVGSRAGTPVMMGKPKNGIFTPVVKLTKRLMGEGRFKSFRADVISQHTKAIAARFPAEHQGRSLSTRWQVSGPQPFCGPLLVHSSVWCKIIRIVVRRVFAIQESSKTKTLFPLARRFSCRQGESAMQATTLPLWCAS